MKRAGITALLVLVAVTSAEAQSAVAHFSATSAPVLRLAADKWVRPAAATRSISIDLRDVPLGDALQEIASRGGLQVVYASELLPADSRVTISLRDVEPVEAVRRTLRGQDLRMFSNRNTVVLTPDNRPEAATSPARNPTGVVLGQVTDAGTGAVLPSVSVVVEGTDYGALTDAGGRYRIAGLPAGVHRVSAAVIGYERATQEVEVRDGGVATVNFALNVAAVNLDRLVVTGNMGEVAIKEMASPISVVDSREIQQKQIQRVDQLFRGEIPGAIAWDMGPYNYYSEISVRGKNSLYFDYIKTYVDGIEVASPLFIASLDPNMIERIEIIRGPQASTLYGSDAAGGVLQVFTKKGMPEITRPQVDAKLSMGLIETDYVEDTPLTQEHAVTVSGGGQDFSYNFGGSYLTMDEYVPEAYTDNRSMFGSARATHGRLTAEFTGRYYTKRFGWPLNPILRDAGYSLWSQPRDETNDMKQTMAGLNLGYRLRPNWQHNLTFGIDKTLYEYFTNAPRYTTPADSFVAVSSGESSRASIRYNTSLDLDLSDAVSATVTAGFDRYNFFASSFYASDARRNNGSLDAETVSTTRLNYNNTGYFVQGKLGISEALFLTAGIRAEENDNFGDGYGRALAPRLGLSYARSVGSDVDLKVRASWGRGIRAPQPYHKQESVTAFSHRLANPDIGPEEQVGWDAGLELYFGQRGSFAVTYYDQLAIDLIDTVLLDASGDPPVYQSQNVGEMANKGWELEGKLNVQPLRFTGSFSTVDSRVLKLAPTYAGDLQVGDRNLKIPEMQGGLSVAWDFLRGSAMLDLTYIGSWVNTDWLALYGFYFGGDEYRGSGRDYWIDYDPVTKVGIRAEQALTNRINVFMRVDNLTDEQLGERDNTQVTAGRTTVLGVRIVH